MTGDRHLRSFGPARHATILRALDGEGSVVCAQLATRLGVSMDTVRRDLAELERAGELVRVHGGAVRPAPGPRRLADRLAQGGEAKGVVAELGAGLVAPGMVVALGGGTTPPLLARSLPLDLEATVVTTSLHVALALREHAGVEVDLLGGRLHRVSQTVTGPDTIAQLRAVRPDLFVLSSCGFAPGPGVTLREREEALVARAMVEQSARLAVLASADKLGTASPYVVADATRVEVLVTDAPPEGLAPYEALGLRLVTPATPVGAP